LSYNDKSHFTDITQLWEREGADAMWRGSRSRHGQSR